MKRLMLFIFLTMILIPVVSEGYPNGTPFYVTDIGPFCASCHAQNKIDYTPELPPEFSIKEISENKHYAFVKSVPSPYVELTMEQKESIIKEAQFIDANSSISIISPSRVKAGEVIKVKVIAKGGNGPVIGVVLVDRQLRNQARPIQADGWLIVEEPEIKGQDGKVQKSWLNKRIDGLKRNINYVMIMDQKYDKEKSLFPSGEITYTLKAPDKPGIYTLAAALLYGTENTEKAGFFQRTSGRILFSEEMKINVE
jgi:hypothetical protein